MLQPGDTAPEFELPNADLELTSLAELKNQAQVVLYFYPKDDTPGCTLEAIEFSDLEDAFAAANSVVIGISKDSCDSHGDFRDKHGLAIRLLSDEDGNACEDYGVWREKEAHGVRQFGIQRSTFIIDLEGKIRHALYDVKPKGHAAAVLELVKAL